MEQNPSNQEAEGDIQELVTTLTSNPDGEAQELVNIQEKRNEALKKFAYFVIRNHYKVKYKKALKNAKTRINIIKEIVKTEEIYLTKLGILENTLSKEMRKLLNSDAEVSKLLPYIPEILKLNQNFLDYLYKRTTNLHVSYTLPNKTTCQTMNYNTQVFNNEIYQIIPYFQIYLQYLSNFEYTNSQFEKLKMESQRKDIRDFIENFEKEHDLISSLLIAPVQRVPRYELLFKALLEKTPHDHQDFQYTQRCHERFREVNLKVNASIQKLLDNEKICELSQTFLNFQNQQLNIIEQKREFKFEERLNLISGSEKLCVVSFLSDMILVQELTDDQQTKPLCVLFLSNQSQIKEVEDMKYFTHLFKISGKNNNLTFSADDGVAKNNLIKKVKELIKNINKFDRDNDLDNIEINILGTEEQNTTKIQKFTVYIAEVKISEVTLKIWVRYSQLSQLEKKIKNNIKDVDIDHFSTKFGWLNSHRTKIIEERKVQFESFLKKILTMKKIRESELMPEILNDLGLPNDFYDLQTQIEQGNRNFNNLNEYDSDSDQEDQQFNQGDNNSQEIRGDQSKVKEENGEEYSYLRDDFNTVSKVESIYDNSKRPKSNSLAAIGTISSAETLKRFRRGQNSQVSHISANFDNLSQNERCLIDIEFLDGSKQEIEINSQSRCYYICACIAKKINLKSYLDYRIFLKDSKGNFRVLDDHELLFKMLFPHQNSLQNQATLVSNGGRSSKHEVTQMNNKQILESINNRGASSGGFGNNDTLQDSSQLDISMGFAAENQVDTNAPLWKYSTDRDKNMNPIIKTFKKLFTNYNEKFTIVFKKYLWLSPEQEEFDIRQDPVRLNLVCYQIFENIQQQRYKLSFKDYVLYSALFVSIKYPEQAVEVIENYLNDKTNNSSSFFLQILKEILPDIIYNSKEENFWVKNISETLSKVTNQIQSILDKNQMIIKKTDQSNKQQGQSKINPSPSSQSSRMQNGSGSHDISQYTSKVILSEKIKMMQMVVINAIKQNNLFGVTQFYVNTYKDTLRDAKELKENVWLGIKHNMIYVLGPEFKEEIYSFKYENLLATKSFPKLIHLKFNTALSDFKFNTTQCFEIRQLITEYQEITKLLQQPTTPPTKASFSLQQQIIQQ